MPLYVVTLREKNNANCERDVYVNATNMRKAEEVAVKANPQKLWKPQVVAITMLGDVY